MENQFNETKSSKIISKDTIAYFLLGFPDTSKSDISPVMPKMSRMFGTRITSRLTANSRQKAMVMWWNQ